LNIVVINNLDVATTLHWHGQLQRGSTTMDGVMGITQCAIAPGASMTYTFKADPPGTFWYHSHAMDHYMGR
jgi:iron transport multicopper oxidase